MGHARYLVGEFNPRVYRRYICHLRGSRSIEPDMGGKNVGLHGTRWYGTGNGGGLFRLGCAGVRFEDEDAGHNGVGACYRCT